MSGNSRGIFAASHFSVSFVVCIEPERAAFSSIPLRSILISVLTPIQQNPRAVQPLPIVPGMQQSWSRFGTRWERSSSAHRGRVHRGGSRSRSSESCALCPLTGCIHFDSHRTNRTNATLPQHCGIRGWLTAVLGAHLVLPIHRQHVKRTLPTLIVVLPV